VREKTLNLEVVACHQPNFLPWLGYFAKIFHADVFFLLDDVQFTQGHGKHNWTTRVRILTQSGPHWLSVPVKRTGRGRQLINQVEINTADKRWLRKTLLTLEQSYKKTEYFEQYYGGLKEILAERHELIAELNIKLVMWLINILGIQVETHRSSDFSVTTTSNQRLIDLTTSVGGQVYLSGDGADDYQLEGEFRKNDVILQRIGFQHPVYDQSHSSEFIPGLSVMDALFNVGAEATHNLLANSRKPVDSQL
jgi:hypothetical protein